MILLQSGGRSHPMGIDGVFGMDMYRHKLTGPLFVDEICSLDGICSEYDKNCRIKVPRQWLVPWMAVEEEYIKSNVHFMNRLTFCTSSSPMRNYIVVSSLFIACSIRLMETNGLCWSVYAGYTGNQTTVLALRNDFATSVFQN